MKEVARKQMVQSLHPNVVVTDSDIVGVEVPKKGTLTEPPILIQHDPADDVIYSPGVIVAELDVIVGSFNIEPALKPMVVAIIMAILSPIMAAIGSNVYEKRMAAEAAAAQAMLDEVKG